MKKIILMAVMSVMTLTAAAEGWFVGGSVGAWRNDQDKVTSITIAPEFGYNLDSHWAIGTVIGWNYAHTTGVDGNMVDFQPYVRYIAYSKGIVSLFVDGGADLGFGKVSMDGYDSDTATSYGIGFKPGISLALNDHCSIEAHAGFLGYRGSNDEAKAILVDGYDGWGFDFSGYNLSFGFYYSF